MKQTYFISDLHLGHPNILLYMQKKRPFACDELLKALETRKPLNEELASDLKITLHKHNKHIIDTINSVVNPTDTLWILGDVSFRSSEALSYVKQINCRNKNLVLGNHDEYSMVDYMDVGFNKIRGMARHKEFILTHAPIHTQQLDKRYKANIHGHLHTKNIDDPRYYNVNIDRTDGKPVSLSEIRDKIRYEQND